MEGGKVCLWSWRGGGVGAEVEMVGSNGGGGGIG